MQPDQPNTQDQPQPLPQDGQTPFQPADPSAPASAGNDLPNDHPATDSGNQPEESYDEGTAGAAEVSDNSGQTAVSDFTPPAAPDAPEAPAADDETPTTEPPAQA